MNKHIVSVWKRRPMLRWATSGLIAGIAATATNVLVLGMASAVHIVTAKGGVFRLLRKSALELASHLTPAGGALVQWFLRTLLSNQEAFHWGTGLAMALVYAIGIAPRFQRTMNRASLGFGAIVWLINSGIVLPFLGEGLAGRKDLNFRGIAVFSVAHFLFFLVLGCVMKRLEAGQVKSAMLQGCLSGSCHFQDYLA